MYNKQYYKEWYRKNREKQLLWGRAYYEDHKEHVLKMHKLWAQKNVDQGGSIWRKYGRRRRNENPNIDKEYRLRKKARLKKVFFLVGPPRSGNTLLSSILNQNPNIAVTANSITADIIYNISKIKDITTFKNFPDHQSFNNIAHHVFDLYYKDWKQTYIIDRSAWGTPANLKILKETQTDIKMIVLTRDIIEVLASYVRWFQNNSNDFKNIEEQCDNLMQGSIISQSLLAIKHLLLQENKNLYHLVKYNDLVKYPERIIKKIYDYLEIPPFEHRYTNLDQFEINGMKYTDSTAGMARSLTHIKTDCISKPNYPVDAYHLIPKATVKKYKKDWLL